MEVLRAVDVEAAAQADPVAGDSAAERAHGPVVREVAPNGPGVRDPVGDPDGVAYPDAVACADQ